MASRLEDLQKILDVGIIAIVRVATTQEAIDVCGAVARGGVKAIEVTMTVPGAIQAIQEFKKTASKDLLLGAGTVLDPETARTVILAGADFIVSPNLNLDVIKMAHRYDKVVVPGCFTPTEILAAWDAGADIVKVFPAGVVGPQYLKDIKGPFPQIRLTPTGGVTLENTAEFIRAGAACVSVATALVDKQALAEKKFDVISEKARQFIEAVKAGRAKK
ncbi:MAG: bifunctional 4-hydroxy-2-oxoglutarate aldolase/2-dehydro-3-deoxy-phosphogluconate aldolase [Dehalococcoidia bacterium]|jgi:2-dehydro-3-deoxyphosphogluconate aldolase/(4S)-4-hydroxy-2-oxoglutarate aldolase|nr:bifunctional 4-hydroxy-2-oxoglutarate aldolase/2-dehydro-3-deoxy-phosphogluconate aldolase [Dehalococcoidia bacterium]